MSTISYKDPTAQPGRPTGALGWLGLPVAAWWIAVTVTGLFVAIYWSNLRRLWLKTKIIGGEAEWAHATLVPLIGLYYLYLHLDELKATPVKPLLGTDLSRQRFAWAGIIAAFGALCYLVFPHLPVIGSIVGGELRLAGIGLMALAVFAAAFDWGIGTLLYGLLVSAYGIYPGSNDFVKDVGMVIAIFGAVLALCGWGVMRIAYFPILFLFCALPWPGLFYSKIAMPLQELSAGGGVLTMRLFGIDAVKEGTTMMLNNVIDEKTLRPVEIGVAEACAGLKSLMMFVSLGAAVAYLSSRPLWQKLVMVASAVPIAILCNMFRVSGMGILRAWGYESPLEGDAHAWIGLLLLVPGFVMLLGVGWVLDRMFIEEADDELIVRKKPGPDPAGGAA